MFIYYMYNKLRLIIIYIVELLSGYHLMNGTDDCLFSCIVYEYIHMYVVYDFKQFPIHLYTDNNIQ